VPGIRSQYGYRPHPEIVFSFGKNNLQDSTFGGGSPEVSRNPRLRIEEVQDLEDLKKRINEKPISCAPAAMIRFTVARIEASTRAMTRCIASSVRNGISGRVDMRFMILFCDIREEISDGLYDDPHRILRFVHVWAEMTSIPREKMRCLASLRRGEYGPILLGE